MSDVETCPVCGHPVEVVDGALVPHVIVAVGGSEARACAGSGRPVSQ